MREPSKIHGKSSAELLRLNGKIKPDRITPPRHVSPRWHWQVYLNSSHPWAEMTGFTNKNWLNKRFKWFNILEWKYLMGCTVKTSSAENIQHNCICFRHFNFNVLVCCLQTELFLIFFIFHLNFHLAPSVELWWVKQIKYGQAHHQ